MRSVSRGAVFWGTALVTAGVVVLAIQQGWINDQILGEAARWWPLFLIGAGVAIILAGTLGVIATAAAGVLLGVLIGGFIGGAGGLPTGCGTGEPEPLRAFADGTFDRAADIEIDLNCVTLEVTGQTGDAWAVEADEQTSDSLDVSSGSNQLGIQADDTVILGSEHRLHVGVTVPEGEGSNLTTRLNAGDATLNLADGQWGAVTLNGNAAAIELDLSGASAESVESALNAGSVTIVLDGDSRVGGIDLSGNAASFDVCAADEVGLQITVSENVATGHNLEEAGLIEDGDVWRTPGYASADSQVEITFSGNAASLNVSPEGDCS